MAQFSVPHGAAIIGDDSPHTNRRHRSYHWTGCCGNAVSQHSGLLAAIINTVSAAAGHGDATLEAWSSSSVSADDSIISHGLRSQHTVGSAVARAREGSTRGRSRVGAAWNRMGCNRGSKNGGAAALGSGFPVLADAGISTRPG